MKKHQEEIVKLKKQMKQFKLYTIGCTLICIMVISFAFKSPQKAYFEELTVSNLRIAANPDSVTRLLLTHSIGDAPFGGEDLPRNVPPQTAGMIYINPNGDEVGGIGWGATDGRSYAINAVDYTGVPLEAIGFTRMQSEEGATAQFSIMDNPREKIDMEKLKNEFEANDYSGEIKKLQDQMVERVNLGVTNHNAELNIKDSDGSTRISISVNDRDEAQIVIMDRNGNVVARIPE